MSLSGDPIEQARAAVKVALAPYFKSKSLQKYDEAVEEVVKGIQPFIRVEQHKKNLGATVMTESASMSNSSRPRSL